MTLVCKDIGIILSLWQT